MITSHVLDIAHGRPAAGIQVDLQRQDAAADGWIQIATDTTNDDGRVPDLLVDGGAQTPGTYRLRFRTGPYLQAAHQQADPFYPEVVIAFRIGAAQLGQHFHIPLLLSPFGFSSYRGS